MEYQVLLLVFYSWLGMENGIPAIIISVLFMAGDGEWNTSGKSSPHPG
jgi:hypothetical protein